MEFRILGPLEVVDGGRPVAIHRGKERALLAYALLHANELLPVDRLVDELWGEQPPPTAPKILQNTVSRLRKALGDGRLVTQAPGYRFRLEAGELDLHRFDGLAEQGRATGDADLLRKALALWRGEPLADLRDEPFAQRAALHLEESRLAVLGDRIDADLAAGRHAELVPELEQLISKNPLGERPYGQLMLALYRAGRQGDALETYQRARTTLNREIGVEPSRQLQELERKILTQDSELQAPPSRLRPGPARRRRQRRRRSLLVGVLSALVVAAAIALGFVLSRGGGGGAPHVVPNSIAVVDPGSGHVVADIPVGKRPVALAVGEGGVWVANSDDQTVSRIDPKTKRVVNTIGVGADVSDIAVGFGSVWVADGNDGTVTRIDPKLNAVQATLRFGTQNALTPNPVFSIATGAGSVWITRGDSIVKINPSAGGPTAIFPIPTPLAFGVGAEGVWVATRDERLLRLDPATGQQTASLSLPAQALSTVVGFGALWLLETLGDGQIWRLDPGPVSTTSTTTMGGLASAIAVGQGAVWVSELRGRVVRIDPRTGNIVKTITIGRLAAVALAVSKDGVWVALQGVI